MAWTARSSLESATRYDPITRRLLGSVRWPHPLRSRPRGYPVSRALPKGQDRSRGDVAREEAEEGEVPRRPESRAAEGGIARGMGYDGEVGDVRPGPWAGRRDGLHQRSAPRETSYDRCEPRDAPHPGTTPFVVAEGPGRTARLAPLRRTREGVGGAGAARGRALPALRAACDAKDPEVRLRASALVDKTEALMLTQPTLVTLDFRDRPLIEVVKEVGDQAGIKLALVPENARAWRARVTLREPAPLPFWKALDRLCDAGHVQYNLGTQGRPATESPSSRSSRPMTRPAGPTSDLGPFRVQLLSLHFQRDVTFASGPRPIEQFFAQVQVAAEPRLSVSQGGPIQVLEAVDDRGQSLMVPARHVGDPPIGILRHELGAGCAVAGAPETPRTAGQDDPDTPRSGADHGLDPQARPLVVPLAGASGKSFRNDQVALSIQDVRANPNSNQTSIELTVQPQGGRGAALVPGDTNRSHLSVARMRTSNRSRCSTPRDGPSPGITRAPTPKARG